MNKVSSFQERLIEAMDGMSMTELASKIGMSKQTVSAYTTGSRNPKRPTIESIAHTLHVKPAWLMGYDVEKFVLIGHVESEQISSNASALQLTDRETQLVLNYRKLSPAGEEYIQQQMSMALLAYAGKNIAASDMEAAE